MKKIISLAVSITLLLTACGQKVNDQINAAPPPAAAVQEETHPPQPSTGPTTAEQPPAAASTAVQERTQEEDAPQQEITPQATQDPEPVTEPAPAEDISSVTVPAKTGCDEDSAPTSTPEDEPEPTTTPEPAPEPAAPANRQAAIDAANAYAATQYGVTTDTSLTLDNSAYRFPAAVPLDASQETLEAKARDMVDFTFHQLMMQAGTAWQMPDSAATSVSSRMATASCSTSFTTGKRRKTCVGVSKEYRNASGRQNSRRRSLV